MRSKQNNLIFNLQTWKHFMKVSSFCSTDGLFSNDTAINVRQGFHGKLISSIRSTKIIGKDEYPLTYTGSSKPCLSFLAASISFSELLKSFISLASFTHYRDR